MLDTMLVSSRRSDVLNCYSISVCNFFRFLIFLQGNVPLIKIGIFPSWQRFRIHVNNQSRYNLESDWL